MSLDLPELPGERVEYRYVSGLPGVELFSADLSRHAFGPHTHDAFAIGTVVSGAQRFHYRGSNHVADRSALMFMNPDELHTGSAASAERWCYRFLHIEPATLRELLGERPASPWFAEAMVHAPQDAEAMRRVIDRLWQQPDALAAAGELSALLDAVCRRHARELPAIEEVGRLLAARIPEQQGVAIAHGDYRFGNCLTDVGAGRIAAVLDWELCTLGDPLADLGYHGVYWTEPGADQNRPNDPTGIAGFPSYADLVERYASRTGRDVGTPILSLNPPDGPSFFGPVISRVPTDEDALRLWDAVVTMASFPGFAEMKRSLRERPQLRAFGAEPGEAAIVEDWKAGSRRWD